MFFSFYSFLCTYVCSYFIFFVFFPFFFLTIDTIIMTRKTVSHFRIYFDGISSKFIFFSRIKIFIYVNPIMYTQFMMALTLLLSVLWHSVKFVCHAFSVRAQWVGKEKLGRKKMFINVTLHLQWIENHF